MVTVELEDVQRLAEHVGMQVREGNDGRNGAFRIYRGRDIAHHADDLEDIHGWLVAWTRYVAA